ncbi:MAG: hypothetical protein JSW27_16510 [Phycisphaerales bacterium]|nr:MAG: hypothetical protein JSW27_16510 [Phycisphaerales bacterium]
MNEGPVSQSHMIETTDCLEAVGVFRGWKNFFFLTVVICLVLAQVSFWLVDLGFVSIPVDSAEVPAVPEAVETPVVADSNAPAQPSEADGGIFGLGSLGKLSFGHLARTIDVVDGILIVTAALYCMAMFFSLMVSLIGRLGGINHISRAFFLSLIMLVLVVPWQRLLESSVIGVIYTPSDLVTWFSAQSESDSIVQTVLYYLRFTGYWLVVMMLMIMSQTRSARWTKSILRRLEII